MTVHVISRQKRRVWRRWLERVGEAVMAAEGCHPEAELSVVIGDDRWIQALNREYRQKNDPTDVLAFPHGASLGEAPPLLGDVAISAETAARQAAEMGHSLHRELALLLAHGILHLTGWEDKTAAQRHRMLARGEEVTKAALAGLRR